MIRAVEWSRDALDDLKAQIAFIARDNPAAAQRVVARVSVAADLLGVAATGRPGRVHGTYEKSVAKLPYVIAYAIRSHPDGETISILRVIHTARDWQPDSWPD